MSRRSARLAMAAVTGILGLLVVIQLQTQDPAGALGARTAQELTVLVANLSDRNAQLRTEVATLEREAERLEAAGSRGESTLDELGRDLLRYRVWSGLAAATGAGVRVSVDGPLDGDGAMELVNELRNAGAEGLAIGGVRLVPGTVVAGPPGGLSIEDEALGAHFDIDAIGSPDGLTGTLSRVGGVIAQLKATYPGVEIIVTPVEVVEIPAASHSLRPAHGTPRL